LLHLAAKLLLVKRIKGDGLVRYAVEAPSDARHFGWLTVPNGGQNEILKNFEKGRIFWPFRGKYGRKRFLQDRELDCQIETQTANCLRGQVPGISQRFSNFTSGTGSPSFASPTGCWGRLKWPRTLHTIASLA